MLQRAITMAALSVLFVSLAATAQSYNAPPPAKAPPSPPGPMTAPKIRTVAVVMQEFRFVPNAITLKVGQPVVIRFTNKGTMEHEFVSPDFFRAAREVAVSGGEFEDGKEVHAAKGSTVTVRLTPTRTGRYRFWCAEKFRGKLHRDLGMRGAITVTR